MDIESAREYCLALPQTTEDFPFDETTLVFRIGGKIFAMMDLENTEWFVLKCQPEYAIELRERHPEIVPAWHMNKKHWNQKRGSHIINLCRKCIIQKLFVSGIMFFYLRHS